MPGTGGRGPAKQRTAALDTGLLKLSSDFYWESDPEHRIARVAHAEERHAVVNPAQLGKTRWETPSLHPDAAGWAAHRATLEAHLPFRDFEIARVGGDGVVRWRAISGEPVFDERGNFKGYRGLGKDITERKRAVRLLQLEYAVTRCLAETQDAEAAVRAVIRTICETENWSCGRYFSVDEEGAVLRFHAAWGLQQSEVLDFIARSRSLVYRPGEGLSGTVWRTGQPLWVSDASKDPRATGSARSRTGGRGLEGSSFVFPVLFAGRTIGVFSFSSLATRAPDERLLEAIQVVASQIGQYLERRRSEVQAERSLRESEERYRHTFELARMGVAHIGLDRRFIRVNRRLCEILGYPEHELVGLTGRQISHPDDLDVINVQRPRLYAGEIPHMRVEKRYLRKDGGVVWVSFSMVVERDAAGTPLYEIAIFDDITERKRAEALLAESEQRFRSLTELSSDWYWEQDAEFRLTFMSSIERLGLDASRFLGRRRWDEPALNLSEADWARHREQLERHQPFRDFEMLRAAPDGGLVWLSLSGEPMFDAAGAFKGYRGIGRDISARKREEALLRLEHAVTRRLADADDEITALQAVIRDVCGTEGWECGRYFRVDEQAGLLRFATAWGVPDPDIERYIAASHEVTYAKGQGLTGSVWQTGEPRWVSDRGAHAGIAQTVFGRARDVFLFPLVSEGKTFGVLVFISRKLRTPDERLLQAVRVIGSQVAQFLQRKRGDEALRERQATHLRYQQAIARYGQSALGKREPKELIDEALHAVLDGLGAGAAAYCERGPAASLVAHSHAGTAPAGDGALAWSEAGAIRDLLERGERQLADGAVLVPVRGTGEVRGALCVRAKQGAAFDAEALNFIDAIASVLSAGLVRADTEGKLAHMAQFDSLTGLPNRALLADRFSQLIEHARRRTTALGALFIDLDGFKLVNDTLGHAAGDELLKQVAVRLKACLRGADTVARISGDEFAVVLCDLEHPGDAALVAQKVTTRLQPPFDIGGREARITASIGIAMFPADGSDAEALIAAADAAMYRVKQSGRNGYEFFTSEINQRAQARAQLVLELRRAMERGEFALAYQPKFELAGVRPCGVEALLRWKHPERGVVPAGQFVPTLEETGLIVPVGDWVLRQVCADIRAWQAAGVEATPVAVNLSARQFRGQDLDAHIAGLVRANGVDPALIELEITESEVMQDPAYAIRVMRALSQAGMCIVIDDFGTGYSSLSYLMRFPVSSLKIDRSFIKDALDDARAAAIVRTIVDMAHTLRFKVIAEGVENEAQATLLRELGCEQAQGYFFARPMPEAELRALLRRLAVPAIRGERYAGDDGDYARGVIAAE